MDREVFDRLDQLEDRHWWFSARRTILERVIRDNAVKGGHTKILEAGCGTGGNLEMLASLGDLVAFEPDDDARKLAAGKSDCEIRHGTLPDGNPYRNEKFDLIVAFDVIEHVEQDEESLAALRRSLAPGGKLIMTVPALPWMWSAHDERHHHFRRYTRDSLAETVNRAGYHAVELTYFNTLLFPLIAGVRMVKKLFGMSQAEDDAMPPAPVNAILRSVFAAERFLIGRIPLPIGVSLLAVLESSGE
ncbi:MAG: class I SAM-dependent methyltransferase [Rhizobiales bacterium]|nr:class I SAM-dependent methyltransferase [Hyphomicrobiales bacterium]